MKKFVFFILIIAVVGVVIYSVVTQISGTIHLGGIFSPELFNYSTTPSSNSPVKIPSVKTTSSVPVPTPQNGGSGGNTPKEPQIIPPTGFTLKNLSPFYGKARLSNIVPPRRYYDPRSITQFSIRGATGTSTIAIDVTGWEVKGNSGAQTYIPKAVSNYSMQAYGTPQSGDVILAQNELLTVYSSKSPIGVNLRLNKCAGYLNNEYKFSPSLTQTCPSVDRSAVSSFSGQCQSFIFSLYGCKEPTANEKNYYSYDNACSVFLSKLNYRGCYDAHRNDADFLGHEWRVWLDHEIPFNAEHDRILLLDKNGLLVDVYTY